MFVLCSGIFVNSPVAPRPSFNFVVEELGETGSFPEVPVEECPGSITIVIFELSFLFDLFSSFSLELFFSSVVFFYILLVSFSEVLPKFTVIHPVATTRILAIINKIILFFFIFFSQIFLINFLIYKIIII